MAMNAPEPAGAIRPGVSPPISIKVPATRWHQEPWCRSGQGSLIGS